MATSSWHTTARAVQRSAESSRHGSLNNGEQSPAGFGEHALNSHWGRHGSVDTGDSNQRNSGGTNVESNVSEDSPRLPGAMPRGDSSNLKTDAVTVSSGTSAEGGRDTVFRAWLDSLLFNFEYFLREINSVDAAGGLTRHSLSSVMSGAATIGEQPGLTRHVLHEQRGRIQKLAKELMATADTKDARRTSENSSFSAISVLPVWSEKNFMQPALGRTYSESNMGESLSVPYTSAQSRRLSMQEQIRGFGQAFFPKKMKGRNRRWSNDFREGDSMSTRCSVADGRQQLQPLGAPMIVPAMGGLQPMQASISGMSDIPEGLEPLHSSERDPSFCQPMRNSYEGTTDGGSSKPSMMLSPSQSAIPGRKKSSRGSGGMPSRTISSSPSARLDRQATAIIENTIISNDRTSRFPRMSNVSVQNIKREMIPSVWQTITSRSNIRRFCSELYYVAMLYSLVFTPVVVCLLSPPQPGVSLLEVLSEIVFIFNVAGLFAAGIEDKETRKWVASCSGVVLHTPWFFTQALAAIPWHLMWLFSGEKDVLLKLSLLRLVQLPQFISESVFGSSEAHLGTSSSLASVHPNLLRVVRLIALFFLMVHLIACGYYSVAASRQGEWAFYAVESSESVLSKWANAFYWSLCGVLGENMAPTGDEEVSYNSAITAIGVMLNSCIVGSITSLLGSLDERAAKQKAKLDTINAFMHKNGVTPDLCDQVRQYYSYLYASASNAELLFEELSDSLRLKIDLCIHKKFIKQCHIFSSCSPECIATLVTIISRNSSIFVPKELVFRKGDIGDAMYFVAKGEVMLYNPGNVLDDNLINLEDLRHGEEPAHGARRLAMTRAGDFFGELALIQHDNVRSASAASMTFAELLCLPRMDFESVLMWYPQLGDHLQKTVWSKPVSGAPAATEPEPDGDTQQELTNARTPEETSSNGSWASRIIARPDGKDAIKDAAKIDGPVEVQSNTDLLSATSQTTVG